MGLFTGPKESDYKNKCQVTLDLIKRGELPTIVQESTPKIPKSLSQRMGEVEQRAKEFQENCPAPESHVEVTLPRTSIVALIGDQHIGHPNTDHKKILEEVEAIKNSPDTYVVFLGDSVDGIFFGGKSQSEQVATLDEQHQIRRQMFHELHGKVIAGFGGEHDSKWTGKSGPNALGDFTELTGAPYIEGLGEIEINVGEEEYKMVAAHKLRGSSIYNNNHPQFRANRELPDADIYASAHTHRKAVTQQPSRRFGQADVVTHVSVGAYKTKDEYSQREGYPEQKPEQMGGVALRLHDSEKKIDVDTSIIGGIIRWLSK